MADASPRDEDPQAEPQRQGAEDSEATVVMQESAAGGQDNGSSAAASQASAEAIAAAHAKAAEHRNDYLRALAELDNVRKRAQRDVENAHRYGLERFVQELLAVKDSLEMGVEAARQAQQQALEGQTEVVKTMLAGNEATLQLLSRAFDKFKIQEINPLGAVFDPQLHEAMTMQPSNTAEPNSVLQVVQKGYRLNDRLLRPARVIVAKLPEGGAA